MPSPPRSPGASTGGSRALSCWRTGSTASVSSAGSPMGDCAAFTSASTRWAIWPPRCTAIHRRGSRRRRGLEAVTRGGRARVQPDACEAAAAIGDRGADAPSPPPARHRDPPRGPPAPARHHDLRGDPDHVRPARAAGPRPAARAGRAHARLPRGLGSSPHHAGARRGVHRAQPAQAGRREAAPRARFGRHAQRARGRLPRAARRTCAAAAADEHRPPRRQGRLLLAGARPHGGASVLPLPRDAQRLRPRHGAPPALSPRRVHLWRRHRDRRRDGGRAALRSCGRRAEAPGRRRRRAHARAWIASRIRCAVSCDRARDGCGSASTSSGGPITTRTFGQRHGVYSERVPSR